jgi:hypothetical protein
MAVRETGNGGNLRVMIAAAGHAVAAARLDMYCG